MIRRARPLLGTVVAIEADGGERAMAKAFAAVERVHRLMNFHSSQGDVARINRAAPGKPLAVDRWTWRVLRHAKEVAERSRGAFDFTIPGSLAHHGDVALLTGGRVRLRRPGRIDLGGIAKGFAVDCAVEALRRNGATRGCVNAGGDLRRFGRQAGPVRVRIPGEPARSLCLPPVPHEAFATSGSYFGGSLHDRCGARRRRPSHSFTVCAPRCITADALTKAVALLGPSAALLRHFAAEVFAVDAEGRLYAPAR